jgi:hypothetical protein
MRRDFCGYFAGALFQIARLQPHPQLTVPVTPFQHFAGDLLRRSDV